MCKSWNINYSCDHTFQFRLSTCRGTFTTRANKAACRSAPTLIFQSPKPCGPCQKTEVEREFEEHISALRASNQNSRTPSEELLQAEEDYAAQDFLLRKRFPGERFVKLSRPEKRQNVTRAERGSLLKIEVKPEDVTTRWTTNISWDDWDSSGDATWKTMEEEMAEQEAEKDDAIKEYEAKAAEELQRWQADTVETEVSPDHPEEEEPSEEPACVGYVVEEVEVTPKHGKDKELAVELNSNLGLTHGPEKTQPGRHDQRDYLERFRCFHSWLAVAT